MKALAAVRQQVLAAQHAEWLANAQAILKRPTVKAVHDMRVAGRKLRAALRLFKKDLPPSARAIDAGLLEVGERLGAARDLDVHLAYLNRTRMSGLMAYKKVLHRRLQTARRDAQRALRSSTFQSLNRSLEALWKPHDIKVQGGESNAEKLMIHRFRKVSKRSRRMRKDPTDRQLHRFRRAVRRMRYAAQFFEGIGKPAIHNLAERLGYWQDIMGDRQDRLTGSRLVLDYLDHHKRGIPLAEEKALIRLIQQLDREKENFQETVLLRWTPAERKKIKRLVKRAF
jgi:triphosphatase